MSKITPEQLSPPEGALIISELMLVMSEIQSTGLLQDILTQEQPARTEHLIHAECKSNSVVISNCPSAHQHCNNYIYNMG